MKYIVYGVTSLIIVTLVVVTIMTIEGKTSRASDVDDTLSLSVNEAITNLTESGKYSIENKDEFVADFCQLLLYDINQGEEEHADPNLNINVSIAEVDVEKGILMLVVEETYTNPNGKISKSRVQASAVLDNEFKKDSYTITYLVDENVYKSYICKKDDEFPLCHKNPKSDKGNFKYWKDTETKNKAVFPDSVDKDYIFEAVFN